MKKLIAIALLSASMAPAYAGNLYLVGSVGESEFDGRKSDIDQALTDAGATNVSSSLDKKDTAYKLQVGYQFNPYLAVEGGYVDLGKMKYAASFTGGNANASIEAKGWNVAAVGILPLNESFSLFAKAGVIDAKVKLKVSASGPGGTASATGDSTDWKGTWGLGATYNFNKQLGLRVEYEKFDNLGNEDKTGKGDVDLISAGVVFKF